MISHEHFERILLTKPSSLAAKQAASNLKMVKKGKSISNMISSSLSAMPTADGFSYNLFKSQNKIKLEGIKLVNMKLRQHLQTTLLPKHHHKPLEKPNESAKVDIPSALISC